MQTPYPCANCLRFGFSSLFGFLFIIIFKHPRRCGFSWLPFRVGSLLVQKLLSLLPALFACCVHEALRGGLVARNRKHRALDETRDNQSTPKRKQGLWGTLLALVRVQNNDVKKDTYEHMEPPAQKVVFGENALFTPNPKRGTLAWKLHILFPIASVCTDPSRKYIYIYGIK